MTCQICAELAISLASAQRIGPADRLEGLTLIGERNREHQYRERVARAMMKLNKHRAQCAHLAAQQAS